MDELDVDPADEIDILLAHTSGQPHELVERYAQQDRSRSRVLDNINKELIKRYGAPSDIARETLNRVKDFADIRAAPGSFELAERLRDYGDLLDDLQFRIKSSIVLHSLNSYEGLQDLRAKLPTYLSERWMNKKAKILRTHRDRCSIYPNPCSKCEHPKFKHFCNFVKDEAENLWTDVGIASTRRQPKTSQQPLKNVRVFTTAVGSNSPEVTKKTEQSSPDSQNADTQAKESLNQTDSNRRGKLSYGSDFEPCVVHPQLFHSTFKCRVFPYLEADKRLEFMQRNMLCYKCLRSHHSRTCTEQTICKSCGSQNHCTSAHLDFPSSGPKNPNM